MDLLALALGQSQAYRSRRGIVNVIPLPFPAVSLATKALAGDLPLHLHLSTVYSGGSVTGESYLQVAISFFDLPMSRLCYLCWGLCINRSPSKTLRAQQKEEFSHLLYIK